MRTLLYRTEPTSISAVLWAQEGDPRGLGRRFCQPRNIARSIAIVVASPETGHHQTTYFRRLAPGNLRSPQLCSCVKTRTRDFFVLTLSWGDGQCWDGIAGFGSYGVCGLLGSAAALVGVLSFANLRSQHRKC